MYRKVADNTTIAPGQSGPLEQFDPPAVLNGSATFKAFSISGFNEHGLYSESGGVLQRICDSSMADPGISLNFLHPKYHVHSNGVLFSNSFSLHRWSNGADTQIWNYLSGDLGLGLSHLISPSPLILECHQMDGSDFMVAATDLSTFLIARVGTASTTVLVTTNDIMAGSSYKFGNLSGIDTSGTQVAFLGVHGDDLEGVYLYNGTTVTLVADTETIDPVAVGDKFWGFGQVEFAPNGILFSGYSSGLYLKSAGQIVCLDANADIWFAAQGNRILYTRNNWQSLWLMENGVSRNLLNEGDFVNGVPLSRFKVGPGGIDGNYIGFAALMIASTPNDGESLWVANLDTPAAADSWELYE